MLRDQWLDQLESYMEGIFIKYKEEEPLTYVRSKRVDLESCRVYMDAQFTVITATTKKSHHKLKIWNRTPKWQNRMFSCGCHDFNFRLKRKKPCKHLLRLIERYIEKSQYIREYRR